MRTEIIQKDGKAIYYMDFSSMRKLDEINQIIQEAVNYIRRQPAGSVLSLTNVEGMHFNSQIIDAFTTFVSGNKPYVKNGAVIGLNGLIRIVFNGMLKATGRNLRVCSSKDEAILYLHQD